ncbi:MAG: response regulator [Gammaproteobacteria bacterium]|nr:response regulator [Gammaproteobacteria bacterium]
MRKVTEAQLRAMGVRTILMAHNGAVALRMLKKQHVDIVLSDWNMPVMTGLELLKAVRADARLSRLPFIMITAEAERLRIQETISCGVSDLLIKPYTSENLITRIEMALERQTSPRHLQAAPQVAVAVSPVIQTVYEIPRATILVVDDTADNLLIISHLFKDEYRVRVTQSGANALEICQSNTPPDLVLLDIMMPGMDGFEVAKRMREHPTSETIPVIFVTAMIGDDARIKGLDLGAVDFVTKPIDPDVLKPRVRNLMRFVAQRKQLQADYDGLLALARLREDVENIMRHDLKGPLAGVIGLVHGLIDNDATNPAQIGQLHLLEETVLQVLDMINLSSELFKIETGRFKLDAKPIMIDEILRRIVNISRTMFAEKHLTIAIYPNLHGGKKMPQALGDAMFCYSLFQNLIKNACEAAPQKSQITVTLNIEVPLRITISNKGAVPAAIRAHFFDKFVTHGKQGGSGLGTYSARLLAQAQNGQVTLAVSDPENLTTITVTLPRCQRDIP